MMPINYPTLTYRIRTLTTLFAARKALKTASAALIVFCFFSCLTPSAGAAESAVSDENIHINADRMSQNQSDGVYTAEGNVVVLWQGMNLTADKVRYAAATHMLHATGAVVLSKGLAVLKGETLDLNMDSGRAEMDSTQLTVPGTGMTVTAEKISRINESEFTATSTELTTCDVPDPAWKFGADKLKVNLLGYAT
ncbi:MAG: LptA/OstA family protein, partial [Desulfuromonadaceae bacterium]